MMTLALAILFQASPGTFELSPYRDIGQADEPKREAAPELQAQEASSPWIAFDRLELLPKLGLSIFEGDYEIDPSFTFSIMARAPLPVLSPASNPDGAYFGLFAEISFTPIERETDVDISQDSGVMSLFTLGADYAVLSRETWFLTAHLGGQYASYGGVTKLNDGFGLLMGATAGLTFGSGFSLIYSPEFILGDDGAWIFVNSIGAVLRF